MQPLLNIALRAARDAADIIVQAHARPDRIKVYEKGKNDFVTDIDQKVEETLLYHIRNAHPQHSFLCEESGFVEGEDKDTVWVIDPIDGTRNFMSGLPHFCISMACLYKGKIQHALIVDPIRNEEFSASKGQGAQLNGTRMRVGKRSTLEEAMISLGSANLKHYEKQLQLQNALKGEAGAIRSSGSSALDLAYVAAGRLDAGWMAGIQQWDSAAGILLVQEAGGLVSDEKGNPDCQKSDNLVFGNARCFKQMIKLTSNL